MPVESSIHCCPTLQTEECRRVQGVCLRGLRSERSAGAGRGTLRRARGGESCQALAIARRHISKASGSSIRGT
eukprot:6297-Rhodomonas_salina.1